MHIYYLLASLSLAYKITARPDRIQDEIAGAFKPAPDPPPAPTPLPPSTDGVLPDGTIINYTPNGPSNQGHSCWTAPRSRPAPSDPYTKGLCTVCVVQRNGTDGSSDYQLWARDDANNAMGNMAATTVWPLDGIVSASGNSADNSPAIAMGGSPLQLHAMLSSKPHIYTEVFLLWATPPRDPNNSSTWFEDPLTPQAMFDPVVGAGASCNPAGDASNGGVIYMTCFFPC